MLYHAQNAIGIARTANADQYAPNTFAKAEQLLAQAQQLAATKIDRSRVVEIAREAAETAEDARVIAEKHYQDEKVAKVQAESAQAQQAIARAEANAQAAKAQAEAAQTQLDADHARRVNAQKGRRLPRASGPRKRKQKSVLPGPRLLLPPHHERMHPARLRCGCSCWQNNSTVL